MDARDADAQDMNPHDNEPSRLAALLRYEILDTPDEHDFDDFTQLAAYICETPIALISLVDDRRQWFKSRVGLDVSETPREIAFCAHTIQGDGIFEVDDARQDARFADNPLVTAGPAIRFYAGAPLTSPDGHNLGTLCVIDRVPRTLRPEQREALSRLARQVIRLFEERLLTKRFAEQAALQHAILDSATSAVLVTQTDGTVARLNPAAERLLGYPAETLRGRPFTTLFAAADLQRRAGALTRESLRPIAADFSTLTAPLARSGSDVREWQLRHRDGHLVPVLLTLSPILDGEQRLRGYLAIAYDLTLQAQLQLRLQQIAAQVPGMLFQFHWRKGTAGAFPYASEGIEQIFGLRPEQIADDLRPIFAVVHPDDRQRVLATIREAAGSVTPWHFEHRVLHPTRGQRWIEARATPLPQSDGSVLWHGLVTDITERKAQQAELDKQQEMNRRLLEALSEGVIACDAQGNLTLFNDLARQWHGRDAAPVPPEQWASVYRLYQPDEQTPLAPDQVPLFRALHGERVRNMELAVLAGSTPRHVLVSADPLFAPDGSQIGAVAVLHDITERKRIERMRREFVATVSHELRTPVTSIAGSLGLISSGVMGEIPAHLQELLDIAYQNSQRLSELVNDLLDMDKLNAGQMRFEFRVQALQPLLEQALRSNAGYAQRYKVSYRLSNPADALVRVDALRLQQVLSNLLSNAAKYSPPGQEVELSSIRSDETVRVSVRDRGPGVAEAFRDRIFQKFAQADSSDTRQRGGTGLGLAISKELVERMGGRIGFDSTPGQGACFWFELPLADRVKETK
ncbi:PAS domain S-box protein [Stutzerimonas urumqiensis]|uniref:PAS domain S-box protein n=1 Tax=Stutzerimonas urumqiensis TaxID=638269 RepID=UPI003DA33FA3